MNYIVHGVAKSRTQLNDFHLTVCTISYKAVVATWLYIYIYIYIYILQCHYGWSRKWQPTSVFLSGKFRGQRRLVGYSPCGHKELDTTERLGIQVCQYGNALPLGNKNVIKTTSEITRKHQMNWFFSHCKGRQARIVEQDISMR